ncbi:MAG: enoyl-CoA hydratase-related protein [Burkholderiaceae bacterium]
MNTSSRTIHQRDERGVHTLTLNAPRSFNVLSETTMAEVQAALHSVAADPQARVLVLAAQGRAFCAGHDLKEMRARPELAYYQALFATCSKLMMSIRQLEVPVIARVQGLATAAGCQLVEQCDLAVASHEATFGVNGIDVGLFCATPSVALSRNMLPKQAMEMLLTGDFISAEEARTRGLVNRVVAPDALMPRWRPWSIALLKAAKRWPWARHFSIANWKRAWLLPTNWLASMACNMAHEVAQEGVQAFIEKRPPSWRA